MMDEPHSSSTDSLPTRRSLLTRLKRWDDREGWQRFYDSYHGLILAMVRHAGLRGADAEEVAQEALVAVARGMKEFHYDPAKGSFKGWLKTVVRRRLVDFLRKQGRERSHLREYVETGAAEAEPLEAMEDRYEQEWERHLLEMALQWLRRRISPRQYTIFDLCVLQERPAAEVARLLGVNRGLVYVVRHRAERLLRQRLKTLGEGKPG